MRILKEQNTTFSWMLCAISEKIYHCLIYFMPVVSRITRSHMHIPLLNGSKVMRLSMITTIMNLT